MAQVACAALESVNLFIKSQGVLKKPTPTARVAPTVDAPAAHKSNNKSKADTSMNAAPLMPIFVRAAELSSFYRQTERKADIANLEQLIESFMQEKERSALPRKDQESHAQAGPAHQDSQAMAALSGLPGLPGLSGLLSEMLKLNGVLVLIDGLDEAADERDRIESWIDEAVKTKQIRVMVSTREYAFDASREIGRLMEFESIEIQGLDEERRELLINRRLVGLSQLILPQSAVSEVPQAEVPHLEESLVKKFCSQLKVVADQNPELATSPFLLSLIIEVFLKDENHRIPSTRVGLYDKQIDGVLWRYYTRKHDSAALMQDADLADLAEALAPDLKQMRFFLEAIAFACQVRLERRDFKWESPDLQVEMDTLCQSSHAEHSLASIGKFASDLSSVGLLSKVGHDELRFNHLTLQEYLAASCAVRLFAHDPQEPWSRLSSASSGHSSNIDVLQSRWRREVIQFAACMLPDETLFEAFCDAVLKSGDGSSACCQLLWDFLKERRWSGSALPDDMVKCLEKRLMGTVRDSKDLLQHASEELRGDRAFMLAAVQHNGLALEYASDQLRGDKEVVLAAVQQDGDALGYASKELRGNTEVVLAAVQRKEDALKHSSDELRGNMEFVLAAVKQNDFALAGASDVLRGDKEVVLAVVKQNGHALKYAGDEPRGDKEVVLAAVQQTGFALKHASDELQGDKEIVLAAVTQDGRALAGASDVLRGDKEVVLAAVKQTGFALKHASDELREDREFVLAAVKENGYAIARASDELRGDREVVLAAVKQTGHALKYAGDELREDREFVLAAVKENGQALKYASDELRGDKEVVLAAAH